MKKTILCLLLTLCACDIKISSTINVSDLLSATNKVVLSDLMIEVSSCDEVQKVITELDNRNISAKYNSCHKDFPNTYAVFSMPLMIIKNGNETQNKGDVYLSVNDNKVYIHSSDRINLLLKSDKLSTNKLKIKGINFNLVNDTEKNIMLEVQYVFVDEKPILSQTINLEQFRKTNIQLSDVANKQLETSNTSFQIMEFN